MMPAKVVIPYPHDPADLSSIYLALSANGTRPTPDAWKPALRDTIDGKRVVWARFPESGRRVTVWVRDRNGQRSVTSMNV